MSFRILFLPLRVETTYIHITKQLGVRTEIACVNMPKYLFQEILTQEEIAHLGK